MRERLVAAFVGLTVLILVMFGLPRAYMVADLVRTQQQHEVSRSAELISRLLTRRAADGERVTSAELGALLQQGERLEYRPGSGAAVSAGTYSGMAVGDLRASRPVSEGGRVTLVRSGAVVEDEVAEAVLPLVAIALVLLVLAAALGFFLSQRLARPFQQLARLARHLGRGDFHLHVPRQSIPEAEAIGSALRSSSDELAALIKREREFAANASHQLRTPITALRLELEDLTLWPETHPEVAAELTRALHELDRLSSAVTDLLDLARRQSAEHFGDLDVRALVNQTVSRWRGSAVTQGRTVDSDIDGQVTCRIPAGPVAQILDVLIHNALKHGEGVVTVGARERGTHVHLWVGDEGHVATSVRERLFVRHVSSAADAGGEGIGLALAAEIAEVLGGRVTLSDRPRTTFDVRLPRQVSTASDSPTDSMRVT